MKTKDSRFGDRGEIVRFYRVRFSGAINRIVDRYLLENNAVAVFFFFKLKFHPTETRVPAGKQQTVIAGAKMSGIRKF